MQSIDALQHAGVLQRSSSVNQLWGLSKPECSEQLRTVYTILVSMPHCWIRGIPKIRYISNIYIYIQKCQSNACHPIWIGLTGAPKLGVQKHSRMGLVFRMKSGQGPVLDHSEHLPSYRCSITLQQLQKSLCHWTAMLSPPLLLVQQKCLHHQISKLSPPLVLSHLVRPPCSSSL
jgi:hypothetical protein